ncbi:MAG: M14 family metallopeptidase [bacterium]
MKYHIKHILLVLVIVIYTNNITVSAQENELTFCEKSGFLETPRYETTINYCKSLAEKNNQILHYTTFGFSEQKRELPLLIANKSGEFDLKKIQSENKSIILIIGCIHAGEPEGKDAGMMLMRDIAEKSDKYKLLDSATILFIPILNADGHEFFRQYSRINQSEPKECGWRTNARNLNLNRDFLKAETGEIKAFLNLINTCQPDFAIDVHSSDGADYQYQISYSLETSGNMPKEITDWQKDIYLPRLEKAMNHKGWLMHPYVSFREWHDPRSGLYSSAAQPKLSHGYLAIRNIPTLLIETHCLKDYKTRVQSAYDMIVESIKIVSENKTILERIYDKQKNILEKGDLISKYYPLKFKLAKDSVIDDFLGVEYDVVKSDISGGDWFVYHKDKPVLFKIPYWNISVVSDSVSMPTYYIIPSQWTAVIEKLDFHGIKYTRSKGETSVKVESYKITNPVWNAEPYEDRNVMTYKTNPINETRIYPANSVIIDMRQSKAYVIMHLLEPTAPDNLLQWGFFNSIFEQKEYAESYVMEKMVRDMLAKDPALKEEFENKKKTDSTFVGQENILNWFYMKTLYWDYRIGVYPVGRIMELFECGK